MSNTESRTLYRPGYRVNGGEFIASQMEERSDVEDSQEVARQQVTDARRTLEGMGIKGATVTPCVATVTYTTVVAEPVAVA